MLNCDTLPTKSNKRYRLKFLGIAVMLAFVFLALGLGMLGERVLAAPLLRITLGFESDPADENAADEYAATVSPGDTITYFLRFKETSDPSTGTLWQILPPGMEILSTDPGVDSQSGDLQSGYVITWSNINIPDDAEYVYTVTASAPVSASMRTELLSEMFFETNQNTMKSDDVSHWLQPYIGKPLWTSVTEGVNGRNEVVAGELLTTTIYYTVPAETYVYSLTPRIQFEEGLVPDDVGATGEITTTFDDWEIGSSAYEVRYPQQTFSPVEDGGVLSYTISGHVIQSDLNNGNTVVIAPLLRWCDAADCDFSLFEENDDYVWWDDRDNVTFLRPEVDPTIVGPTYLDALTQGEGGGQVQFFLENANLSDSAIAYDLVLTATLGPGLEFASSMPAAPDGQWTTTVGGPTYLTWTVPISVVEGAAWPVTITANLPDTLVYGQYFTVTSAMYQETFAGDQPYEGKYVEVDDSFDFYAELDVANASKTASRANMRIGEFVSYTTVFTVSPNATLANFRSEDLLGAGLHYVTQTLTVDGATLDDVQVQPDGASERLVWSLGTINTGNDALVVTVVYQAWLDAVGLDGVPTFVGGRISDFFTDDDPVLNESMFYWADPLTPATERSLELADVRVEVYQSNISELTSENSSLTSEFVSFPNNELGNFVINFTAERGFADAYDVRICQDLPIGVVFDSELGSGYDDHGCGSAYVAPSSGDSGTICWEIDQVCNTNSDSNNMNTITYRLLFSSAALSGWYAPRTYVAEYTSLPGTVDGERYYSEFDYYNNDADFEDVLMETDCSAGADCPFEIVGWGLNKDVNPEVVSPGEVLVYTISYSNTSSTNAYTSFMITDTYDALLTVVSAPNAAHDPVNRTLVWDIDNLSAPTSRTDITFSAQVDSVISGVYGLSNRVDATADGVLPTFYTLDTDIKVALLDVALSSPVTWTHAAGVVTYTVTYTNTGSAEKPYTLTFAYDPYLSYGGILYTDGAVRVSDAVFTDSVPANTTRVLEVTTTVAHPLPYDLESLTSSVTVESPGAEAATDELEVLLKRPQFGVFEKTSFESFVPTGGSSIRYNVEITNTGDYIATNCVITDTWDAGQMSFDDFGSPDWSSPGAGTALWDSNPFTLTPGSGVRTTRLTLNIEATVPYYENHVDIVCDQVDQVPTERHVLQSASLQTTKTASDEIAFPDRVLTYTILYTNTNVNSAIVNAVITDVLPSGFSLIDYTKSDQLSGCQFGEGDGTVGDPVTHVYWTCDSLLAGATGTLQVWGMVVEPEGGTLTNRTETDGAGIPFREGDVVVVLPATRPKLALTQTLSSPYVYVAPGDLVTYTLLYQNHGTARADDVQVAIELPSRVSYVSGGTLNGDVVEWSLGSVDAGAEDTLTLVVEAGTVLGEVSFVGFQKISSQRLTWDDAETIYAAEDVIEIKSPSLALVKTVEPRTASYGDVITFTVVFSNNGGGVLTGVMLEDMFNNQYVTYNGASAVECVDTINGDVTEVVCDGFGDFIPEQERTIEFYVVDDIPNTTTDQTITNTATIDSDQTNPLTSNEVLAVHNPTCTPLTGVTLAQPSSSSIEIGESATFTATVEPSGAGTPYNYKAIYDDGTTQTTQTGTASSSPFTWSSPFNTVGNYTVTVAVWNCWLYESEALMSNEVSLTVTEMCYETVDPSFTYAPQNPTAGDTVYFTGTVTGTMPITYYWNFGEGPVVEQSGITSTSTIMIPTSVMHTFTMSNTYTVIMTATNACGVDVSYAMDVPVSSGETFIYLPLVLKNQS